ncbi:hypothetical protein SISSUDRAFT_89893 [Sistotremastrum suecicum HHB10207 ss-3]|uniref:F-box domain-containing protein n=1 Tax=Sistotremastrum suecicum HHB10207 ss-3 TaxID=1314776 RepID=A0A166BAK6_9AGAM|nr:hypothetical protein SISSUDRAFT_89893 [Sistotremastrum suecicum HHB10207 ss-3]
MASFQTLPDELTLLVLRGLLLEDVLNVSRTSRYLRYITHSYPDVWKNTEDARHIPLLLGQTLSTVPTVLLPKLVARSVSISQTLSKPFLDPRRCTRLEIEAQTSSEDRAHDYWWRLTPKQIYSLPGGRIVLCRWDCKVEFYGAEKGEFIGRIELPESISMHWESFDCGRTMKFASLCSRIVDEKLELSILTYDIDFIPSIEPEEGFVMKLSVPSTIILPSIYTPTYFPGSILLRGSMVLVQADDHILVVNMDRRTGVMFMSDQPPEEHAFFFDHDFKVRISFQCSKPQS